MNGTEYQAGFFDVEFRVQRLTQLKDPLVSINTFINWEAFVPILSKAFPSTDEKLGGRPAYDKLMMFKILILQQIYGLSDGQAQFQITDRISFMRFLNLSIQDQVPDNKTIWLFRDTLTKKGVIDELFNIFVQRLEKAGLILNKGQMVDASIVKAPIQRNNREENQYIKDKDRKPAGWSEAKSRQKDIDANWVTKNKVHFFGYKNHIKADKASKLITNFQTTPASVHDSQVLEELLEPSDKGQRIYGDSAYKSEQIAGVLKEFKMIDRIHEKGYKHKPLTSRQKASNKGKSKYRARVEHIFGSLKQFKSAMQVRCIGLERATAIITLQNITYNMFRAVYLVKLQGIGVPV